jgi:hypothetical protein
MVGVRPLTDGGLLVLLDGKSHSVYWREEVGALRLMVDTKTCLIEQENDQTQLRSPSPGKLNSLWIVVIILMQESRMLRLRSVLSLLFKPII